MLLENSENEETFLIYLFEWEPKLVTLLLITTVFCIYFLFYGMESHFYRQCLLVVQTTSIKDENDDEPNKSCFFLNIGGGWGWIISSYWIWTTPYNSFEVLKDSWICFLVINAFIYIYVLQLLTNYLIPILILLLGIGIEILSILITRIGQNIQLTIEVFSSDCLFDCRY